jgi:hypothetical protein
MELRNVCARYSFFGLPLTTVVTYLWSLRLLHLGPQSDMFGLCLIVSFSLFMFVVCVHMLVGGRMGVHVCSGLMIGN